MNWLIEVNFLGQLDPGAQQVSLGICLTAPVNSAFSSFFLHKQAKRDTTASDMHDPWSPVMEKELLFS